MTSLTSGRHSRYPAVNRTPAEYGEVAVEEVVEKAPEPKATPAPIEPKISKPADGSIDVADMTIEEIIDWVGDDPDRRGVALAQETKGKKRKTLLSRLQSGD